MVNRKQIVVMEKCNSNGNKFICSSNRLLCFQYVIIVIVIERKQSNNNRLHCNVISPGL